jgi:septal ring factor EnvC (AmiA/AmiB activator)
MRRSGVQVLYPAPFRWITAAHQPNAMKVSVEFLFVFAGRVAMLSLLSGVLVLSVTVWDGRAVARAAGAETLPAAQTRLRYAEEELESAQLQVRRQEQRVKDAEDSLARQQKRVEEEQAKVERSRSALADAKARVEQAKQKHEQAYADIQRLYRERQQPPGPGNPPEAARPLTN